MNEEQICDADTVNKCGGGTKMKTAYTMFYEQLQDSIDTAWNQAEEIHSGLDEMTDEEIIETRNALKNRANKIMCALDSYAKSKEELT